MDIEWEDSIEEPEPRPRQRPRRSRRAPAPSRRGAPPDADTGPVPRVRRGPSRTERMRASRGATIGETGMRVLIAVPLIALAIFLIDVGGWVFAVGMAVLAGLTLQELYSMTARARPILPAGLLASTALILVARSERPFFHLALAAVCMVPVMFALAVARPDRRNVTFAMATTIFGVVWIGVPFAHAVLLRDLGTHGAALMIDVLVGTFVADTAAYFGGRAFGQTRFAPAISPGKTTEGLIAGVIGGTAGIWFAGLYQDWMGGTEALVLGLAVALAAPVGDLFESMVKRDLGVKDSSSVLGAHGGLLDRLDAVMFTIVVGYYVAAAFGGFA